MSVMQLGRLCQWSRAGVYLFSYLSVTRAFDCWVEKPTNTDCV